MTKSVLGALVVLMFVAVGIAAAPPLTFTFSDVHASKTAIETDSFAINDAGAIAGDYVDSANVQHGMILAGKKLTTVDHKNCVTSGGFNSGAIAFYGINKKGAAAGWCADTQSGLDVAFVYSAGKFTAVKFPKAISTQAIGINDKGDVVGLYVDSGGTQHGFLKKSGGHPVYANIDVKGDTNTEAWGINNSGQIAVFAVNSAGGYESFLYNGKTFKKVSDPNAGATGTIARIVNNKGDVAGVYFDASNFEVGFLRHGGKYYDVKDPKANNNTRPDGLNSTLVIVGRYTPTDGSNVGFKAVTKASAGSIVVSAMDSRESNSDDRRSGRRQALNTP